MTRLNKLHGTPRLTSLNQLVAYSIKILSRSTTAALTNGDFHKGRENTAPCGEGAPAVTHSNTHTLERQCCVPCGIALAQECGIICIQVHLDGLDCERQQRWGRGRSSTHGAMDGLLGVGR